MTHLYMSSQESARLGLADLRPLIDRWLTMMREELADQLVAVTLFGSVARGQARALTDIDLIVVFRGSQRDADRCRRRINRRLPDTVEYQALLARGITADPWPIYYSEDYLKDDMPWILVEVQDHGIILYDPEGFMARKLQALRRRLRELGSQKIVLEDGTWYWDLKPDWKPGEVFEL